MNVSQGEFAKKADLRSAFNTDVEAEICREVRCLAGCTDMDHFLTQCGEHCLDIKAWRVASV